MALVNYMGDAPGFMSYRRQPSKDMTGIPQRATPAQKEFKQEDFEFDAKGNPGDKQFVYDQQKEFNSGLQSLFNEYGGEMDWVVSDPRYQQLTAQSRWAIYDKDAAEQNEVTSRDREKDLNTPNSGHSGNDIEMIRQPDGSYVPRYGAVKKGGFASKEEVLQQVIQEPQLYQREDGSVGVQYVDFDNGVGSEKDFNEFVTNILVDGHVGMTRGAGSLSQTQNQEVTEGMNYAVDVFTKNGYDNSSNYQQIEDGVNYLLSYGMSDQQEYYLWNSFYKDVAKQKSFKMPKTDENGEILKDKNGKAVMQDIYVSDEDINDLAKRKVLFNIYAQDRIMSYSKKFKEKSTSTTRESKYDYKNIDPRTGQVIEDPNLRRWESVVMGYGPAGEGFTKTESYPVFKGGKLVGKEHDLVVYDASNFAPGMEQAKQHLVGKTIGSVDNTGFVQVGKKWQSIPEAYKGFQISDVQSVRQVPAKSGKGVEWVARVLVVSDDDQEWKGFKVWNPESGKTEDAFGSYWGGVDFANQYAEQQGYAGYMSRSDANNKGYKISGDRAGDLFDSETNEVSFMYIDVPITNSMIQLDQYGVGEKREAEGESIEIGANVKGVTNATNKNTVKANGKGRSTF